MFLLFYLLPLLLFYTVCGWLVLGAWSDYVNRKRLPGRRIPIRRGRVFVIVPLLLMTHLAAVAFLRPPEWRGILYEEMFNACRDDSLIRARLWLFLGASLDGSSDYAAGPKWMEFSSHVHTAATHKDCRLLRLLLEKGASPNLELGDGSTPMTLAIHDRNACAVKLLLDAGADAHRAMRHAGNLKAHDLVSMIQPYLGDK